MAGRMSLLVVQRLASQWDRVVSELQVLNTRVELFPNDGYGVFKPSDELPLPGSVRVDLNPVAIKVPERATDMVCNIYIAISGYLYLDSEAFNTGQLRTTGFGTRVAYFRKVGGRFDHVFGAHFDYSENELGHPLFHGQFKNLKDMFHVIADNLKVAGQVETGFANVLSTVRLPTAQLDVFSLLLQVFADHLLSKTSNQEEKAAFNRLLAHAASIQGAGHRVVRLQQGHVEQCMGARHWYPVS
jgi:hypothetical protein